MKRIAVIAVILLGAGAGVAYAATLAVGTWHLWGGGQSLTKATCTLTGTGSTTDTYVDEQSSGSSFGASTTLLTNARTNKNQWLFVRFDLSSCNIPSTGGADSATLKLFLITPPGATRTLTVTPVTSTWSGTLTWTAAQSLTYGSATTTFATGTSSGVLLSATVTADVDALIKNGSANYGWRVDDQGASGNSNNATFGASEHATPADRPQLVINYEK